MRVNPNSEIPVVETPGRLAAQEPRMGQDKLTVATSSALNDALEQTPEVRADKVAEAKALIQNGSYPPEAIIRKISALLAVKIDSQDSSG